MNTKASRTSRQAALYVGRGRIKATEKTLLELFFKTVEAAPKAPALAYENVKLSYVELYSSAKTLAAWMIHEANIKPGDRVSIYLPNSLSYGVALYAAWLTRAVVVNLGISINADNVLFQLQDSGAKLLITAPTLLAEIQPMLLQTGIRHIVTTRQSDYANMKAFLHGWVSVSRLIRVFKTTESLLIHTRLRDILSKRSHPIDWPVAQPNDIALMQYTSGTTGRPKGALLTHSSLLASLYQGQLVLGRSIPMRCQILCPLPLQHILGITNLLFSVAKQGCVALTSINNLMEHPEILQHPYDAMLGIPLLFDQLLKKSNDLKISDKLTMFMCGGSPVSLSLHKEWYARTGHFIIEGYGLSEASPLIAATPPNRVKIGTSGVITPETQVRIVSNQGGDLGFNQAGELWVRGPQLMRGYWQLPQVTSEVLTHDGWLRTGDIASLDEDGYLRLLERKKDVFWVQNELVFPREIENAATEHEDVIDCLAVQEELHSDHENGVAQRAIKLFVVAREGLTPERLSDYLHSHLKGNEIPDKIEFVDQVPRGPMGKVLRHLFHELPHKVVTHVDNALKSEKLSDETKTEEPIHKKSRHPKDH
ncbi:MAG: AMP-binding protein [Candidatus Saccharibacteria bacterium]|nr:AMP-binding protein [Moraxellaceae bacterium]